MARLPDEARAVVDASAATLRIASTHALSFTFLPGWLRSLESHLVVGPIQLMSDVMQQCEALMQQGRAQFMLAHAHAEVPSRLDPAAYASTVVGHDELIPLSAPDKAGQPRHALRPGTKGPVPILAYSAESGIGRLVRALRGGALDGVHAQPVVTAHLATVLRTMVLDGRGVAWLPRSLVADELASGRLVAAGDAALGHRGRDSAVPPARRRAAGGGGVLACRGRGQPTARRLKRERLDADQAQRDRAVRKGTMRRGDARHGLDPRRRRA